MSIYDFVNMLTDDAVTIAIYDYTEECEIFRGEARDAMFSDYSDYEIMAIDFDGIIILNIETDSEED